MPTVNDNAINETFIQLINHEHYEISTTNHEHIRDKRKNKLMKIRQTLLPAPYHCTTIHTKSKQLSCRRSHQP